MAFFERFTDGSFGALVKDQRLRDLLVRREFRISADYVRREVIPRLEGEEVSDLTVSFREGYGEVAARVKKRFVPFPVPFSARFVIGGHVFTPREKKIQLRLEEVKPVDFDWLTRRLVDRVPFLAYGGEGMVIVDLAKVPRVTDVFEYRLRGVRVSDFITLKEIDLREGEVVGKVGVVL